MHIATPPTTASSVLERKRPMSFLVGLAVYALGINYVWFSFSAILLPVQVETVVPAADKSWVLGLIVAVSVGVGIVFNIIAGIYSDHSRSPWGRRTPTIFWGALLTLPCLALAVIFPLSLLIVSLTFFGQQFFTNISSGGYQPLLADLVPEHQRGAEAGLQGAATLIGSALSFAVTGLLTSQGHMVLALLILAAIFGLSTLVTLAAIRPLDRPVQESAPIPFTTALREMFRVTQRAPGFFWFVVSSFAIYLGVNSFQYFGIYYFETVLKRPNPTEAMAVTGLVNLVVSMIAALLAGFLSDRLGRRNLIICAAAFAGTINLAFPFVRDWGLFIAIACLYAAMLGVFLSVNMALASDLVPKTESGKFMAYNNLAVGAASGISPMLGGLVLSAGAAWGPASFMALFVATSIYFYVGSGLLFKVPKL